MTVCVAALCDDNKTVVAASDQMVSTDDNQTKRLKIHHLTTRVIAMIAGDVNLHTELLAEVRSTISLTSDRPELHTVKNVADAFASAFIEAKRRRAENTYLKPLGLTLETFLAGQRNLEEKIATDLTRQVVHFPMPPCSALFVGVDESLGFSSAHIYTVQDGQSACHNDTGFAAIGVGRYQAISSLMFGGHHSLMGFDAVIYLTLAAKKRAEVAPGVGKETDMVFLTTDEPKYIVFRRSVVDRFEAIYQTAELAHTAVNESAIKDCDDYLQQLRDSALQSQQENRPELTGTAPAAEPAGPFPDGSEAEGIGSAGVQHHAGGGSQEEG